MKHFTPILLFCVILPFASAAAPLHKITLKSGASFQIGTPSGAEVIAVYSLSERMKGALRKSMRPQVEAADYAQEISIRTTEPKRAIHEVLSQVIAQTGRALLIISNRWEQSSAAVTIAAADSTSVWFFALTPAQNDSFNLSCVYLIDDPKQG